MRAGRALPLALVVSLAFAAVACVGHSRAEKEAKEKLKAYILDAVPPNISHKLATDFDGKVKLVGASIEPDSSVKPGQQLKVTLYWKSAQKLESGWSLFTHVLDAAGERILNLDNVGPLREIEDGEQKLPPSSWDPGKIYADVQTFTVPPGIKSNRLTIVTGLWRGNDRLKIVAGPHDSQNRGVVASLSITGVPRSKPKSNRVPNLRVDRLAPNVKIEIDGKLDEEAWKTAADTGPFVDVRSGETNPTAPVNGHARLLWNDQALFVGFEVTDADVVGGFPKDARDPHLWTKDTVEIMLDPDGDGDNDDYYEIQIGPQNLVFDSQFDHYNEPKTEPDGPFGHQDWSANLKSAVRIDGTLDNSEDKDKGYTVEAMLPWKSFSKAKQVPPKLGDTWRMNLYAMQNNGGMGWSAILAQGNFHKASRFGRVTWAEAGWSPPAPTPAPSASVASAPSVAAPGVPHVSGRDVMKQSKPLRSTEAVPQKR